MVLKKRTIKNVFPVLVLVASIGPPRRLRMERLKRLRFESKVSDIYLGKTDKVMKTMILWRDHHNPKFCFGLHLQFYMYLTGWRGGQLFPNIHELLYPPADLVFLTALGSQVFDFKLKDVAQKLFLPMRTERFHVEEHPLMEVEEGVIHSTRRKKTPTWGSQSCRKTGYLFAIWGGGEMSAIMYSARHIKAETAVKYALDLEYI